MKRMPIFLCIMAGLMSGLICTAVHLSFDINIKKKLETYLIHTLEKGLLCSLTTEVESINLLTGTIVCSHIAAHDAQHTWKWSANRAHVSFSWLELILTRILRLTITLYEVNADSQVNQTELALSSHIKAWIHLPAGPIVTKVKTLSIRQGHLAVSCADTPDQKAYPITAEYTYNGELAVTSSTVQIACTFSEGQVQYQQPTCSFNNIHGVCHVSIPRTVKTTSFTGDINLSGVLCLPSKKPLELFIGSTYQADKGTCFCHTRDSLLHATLSWQPATVKVAGKCNASLLAELLGSPTPSDVEGECLYTLSSTWKELLKKEAKGTIRYTKLRYQDHVFSDGTANVQLAGDALSGDYQLTYKSTPLSGTIQWDLNKSQGTGTLANTAALKLPLIGACDPNHTHLEWHYGQNKLSGTYNITPLSGINATGSFVADKASASLKLACNNNLIDLHAQSDPHWHVSALEYTKNNDQQVSITCTPDGDFKGDVDYQVLKEPLVHVLGIETSGSGSFAIRGTLPFSTASKNKELVPVHFSLTSGQIRLASTYNILEQADICADIDYNNMMVSIKNGRCRFNKGEILIPYMSIVYTPEHQKKDAPLPVSVFATLLLKDCFIHWKKDMVSTVSGFLSFSSSTNTPPLLKGYIVLDTTHIQSNILSSEFEHKLAKNIVKPFALRTQHDIKLHVGVVSHSPVHIKTQFLTADAHFYLTLNGSLNDPELSGTIYVTQGKLNFPYQPLHITQGRVYFLSNQLHDPTFELVAKNRIKKYTITMYASGSLKQPHILNTWCRC